MSVHGEVNRKCGSSGDASVFDQQRTLATRAGYDALRHSEILVFEPDLGALVRRNGKARGR
jgi:hypothetical protein